MLEPEDRISYLIESIDRWLSKGNRHLERAVNKTVEEEYFSFKDVRHSIVSLHESLTREDIIRWAENSGLFKKKGTEENILCLHAGNIPLAGFQNALAVLLSGARYTGKISKKDPYLLPTFLNEVKKTEAWSERDVQWVHQLDDLHLMLNDKILFAGSERSVPKVKNKIRNLEMEKKETKYLIRTAHFSLAFLDNMEEETLESLTEAVLRYGGMGCRSVAMVVAPTPFKEVSDQLQDKAQQFLRENPQHLQPPPALEYRRAYNEAVGRHQVWLGEFLYQENGLELDQDFTLHWVEGDEQRVEELDAEYHDQLQSIYIPDDSNVTLSGVDKPAEPLSTAQEPPVDWKPDGVDTLQWLLDE